MLAVVGKKEPSMAATASASSSPELRWASSLQLKETMAATEVNSVESSEATYHPPGWLSLKADAIGQGGGAN